VEEARGGVQEEGVALVLDSNILFSIVIAGSRSRAYHIIKRYELSLYMPKEALIEFHRHAERGSGGTPLRSSRPRPC